MVRLICTDNSDELRLICPQCRTTWASTQVPAECLTCSAAVTIRVIRRSPKKDGNK